MFIKNSNKNPLVGDMLNVNIGSSIWQKDVKIYLIVFFGFISVNNKLFFVAYSFTF